MTIGDRDTRLGWVEERDIDLLLLEEFHSDQHFIEWWLERVGHAHGSRHPMIGGWQSVTEGEGESDLIIDLKCDVVGVLRLLVEDKVGAVAQPEQSSRYTTRAARHVSAGECDLALICIVAPEAYLNADPQAAKYGSAVTYEGVREWFLDRHDPRSSHKAKVLTEAIDQQTRGYQKREVPTVTAFMAIYREIASTEFAALNANPPEIGSSKGGWVYCHPATLPARLGPNPQDRRWGRGSGNTRCGCAYTGAFVVARRRGGRRSDRDCPDREVSLVSPQGPALGHPVER